MYIYIYMCIYIYIYRERERYVEVREIFAGPPPPGGRGSATGAETVGRSVELRNAMESSLSS